MSIPKTMGDMVGGRLSRRVSQVLKQLIDRVFHKLVHRVSWQLLPKFQDHVFQDNLKSARRTYSLLQECSGAAREFFHPAWEDHARVMESYFLEGFDVDFIEHPVIQATMVLSGGGASQRAELQYLTSILTKSKMQYYLRENRLGNPTITSISWLTSHTSIHHLYHLMRFEQVSQISLNQTTNIIEFGGGYGNMAKIYRRINPVSTYVIVDLPVFCCIQHVYLATVLGRDSVYLVSNPQDHVRKGKINLMPVGFMEYLEDIPNGLFVSTWGLSESTAEAQSFIQKKEFFNAKSILLAFQANNDTFQFAENVVSLVTPLKDKRYHLEEISFLEYNYYLFAWDA